MKVEVGESYLTEDGRIVNIIEKYDNDNYMDADDYFYNEEGVNDFVCSDRNLIAHIPKELHFDIIKTIKAYHSDNSIKEYIDYAYPTIDKENKAIEAKIELFPVNKGKINNSIYSIEVKEYEDEVILTKIWSKE